MFTTTRRGIAAAAIAAVAIAGVAACGAKSTSSGGDGTPQGTVRSALTSLSDGNALTMTFKFDATTDDFKRLAASGNAPEHLSDADAKALAGGSIEIAVKTSAKSFSAAQSDKNAAKKSSLALTVNAGDASKLVEVRYINGELYARADVKQIVSYTDTDFSHLQSLADSQGSALPFLKPALAGGWLKLPLDDLEQLAKASGGSSAQPSVDPAQIAALQKAILGVFDKDLTVTKADDGSSLGDHYVLSGSSRTVATDLVAALKTELANLPGAKQAFADADPTKVPDKTVKVDAYVKGGTLSAIKLDISQFASGDDAKAFNGKPFYLELDIDGSANISVPSGATDVNLGALIGGLGKLG